MKTCIDVDSDGYLYITSLDPTTQACKYILTDSAVSPFDLSLEEGGQIAAAILAVWAVAFICRLISRMVLTTGD